jgi:hypothetical protein
MTNPIDRDVQRSKAGRIVTAVFGVFLIVLAIVILLSVEESMGVGALVASLVVGLLGVDACVSAARNKRSLVERIGPLP